MIKTISAACAAALLAAAALPALAQTASTPTDGPTAPSQIVVTGQHKSKWDKGSALERKGLAARSKAQQALSEASRDVIDAQNKRDNNRALSDNASRDFRQLTNPVPEFVEAADAARWAKKVDAAASRWAKANEKGDDGAAALRKAMKAQEKAQGSLDKAQQQVEQGRAQMAEAERASLPGGAGR